MEAIHVVMLVGGGLLAGFLNTVAGGGSLLSVPLLYLVGLPAQVANGSNRVGVLLQSAVSSWRFGAEGVSGLRDARPLLAPVCCGALVGAYGIAELRDEHFEQLFGLLMLALAGPALWGSRRRKMATAPRSRLLRTAIYFAIGVYGGAVQAGVGFAILAALAASGLDLVRANSVKVVLNVALTAIALVVFLARDLVAWPEALVLAAGSMVGAAVGARCAVRGGEAFLRPVTALTIVALAGHMLGLY